MGKQETSWPKPTARYLVELLYNSAYASDHADRVAAPYLGSPPSSRFRIEPTPTESLHYRSAPRPVEESGARTSYCGTDGPKTRSEGRATKRRLRRSRREVEERRNAKRSRNAERCRRRIRARERASERGKQDERRKGASGAAGARSRSKGPWGLGPRRDARTDHADGTMAPRPEIGKRSRRNGKRSRRNGKRSRRNGKRSRRREGA